MGLSFGQKHSLALDFGCITGYVDKLNDNVDYNENYLEKPHPLVTKLETAFFWSIGNTYRL